MDEYRRVSKAFQPMTPSIPLEDIVVALRQLHPIPLDLVPPFILTISLSTLLS
jgi:hypothetical protein